MKASTAADYRRRQSTSDRPTQLVTVPSGFVWELRSPNILAYMATGRYPQSLVNKGLEAWKKSGKIDKEKLGEQVLKGSSDEEIAQTLIFMRQIVTDACVKPRIVVGGIGDDELDPVEVDPDDFRFIFSWCMEHGGVQGIDALNNFRGGQQRGAVGAKSDGKKLRTRPRKVMAHT